MVTAKKKGKVKREGQLSLTLTSITVHGRPHAIRTGVFDSTVKGKGKRTAAPRDTSTRMLKGFKTKS